MAEGAQEQLVKQPNKLQSFVRRLTRHDRTGPMKTVTPEINWEAVPEEFRDREKIWQLKIDDEYTKDKTYPERTYLIIKEPIYGTEKSQVHKAWDTRLGKIVAIKASRVDPDSPVSIENEAVTIANLEHKNIVRVYNYFSTHEAFNPSGDADQWRAMVM